MRRLVLLRHASTAAVRRAGFPLDEPLDAAGEAAARALGGQLGGGEALCGTALRARTTAALAGLDAVPVGALDECDFGSWRGLTLAEVHAADPGAAVAWMTDPDACPHAGESLRAFAARVAAWLDEQAAVDGRAIAVTHGGVIKAAVGHALGASLEAFWRIDVAPLRVTELHAHEGRWTVASVNAPVGAHDGRSAAPSGTGEGRLPAAAGLAAGGGAGDGRLPAAAGLAAGGGAGEGRLPAAAGLAAGGGAGDGRSTAGVDAGAAR